MKAILLKVVAVLFVLPLSMAFTMKDVEKDRWIHDATIDNVEFYHQIIKCESNRKRVALKINNKNTEKVTVSWTEVFTVEPEEELRKVKGIKWEKSERITKGKEFTVEPGEISETNCANAKHIELLTFPVPLNPVDEIEVVSFKFKDIKITK